MKSLKTIDYRLGVADRKVRLLNRLNPVNANKERRTFLYAHKKGAVYNPIFRYKAVSVDLDKLERELNSMHINVPTEKSERWFFSKYLEGKRKRVMQKIESLRERGGVNFTHRTKQLFGRPGPLQLQYAKSYLVPDKCSPFDTFFDDISAEEAARILGAHIEKGSLPWRVRLSRVISSKAGLDSRSKYLLIKSGERFSREELESLATHEIETHIFRRENGLLQQFPHLFGEGFAGPPTIEEGLAFFNETQQETSDPRRFLIICARTIASHLAYKKSFFEVFRALTRCGLPDDYAWSTTLRVKRGLSDTSQNGSFSKDHHYLKGYLMVKRYIDRGGSIEALYVGKINIGTVGVMDELGIETKEPKYLPKYLAS